MEIKRGGGVGQELGERGGMTGGEMGWGGDM